MSKERFRRSALRLARHHGAVAVTLTRGSVALSEAISGEPATLTCGVASEDDVSLPMTSAVSLTARLDPGVAVAITGHSLSYVVQAKATPVAGAITVTIAPGLEAAVSGEAITLTPRSLSFQGGQVNLKASDLPAGWSLGAGQEVWALVPPSTTAGQEPRPSDIMTSPIQATVAEVSGREGVEYLVLMAPIASEEAA